MNYDYTTVLLISPFIVPVAMPQNCVVASCLSGRSSQAALPRFEFSSLLIQCLQSLSSPLQEDLQRPVLSHLHILTIAN